MSYFTGKNWRDCAMKQNYDRYVFSKKEWILDIVEQYNIYETIKEAKSLLIILKTT